LIAVLEIVGGVNGLATIFIQLINRRLETTSTNQALFLIAIHLLALFAGIMLWRDTRIGRVTSIVCQLIQLPKLLSPEFAFMVSFGIDFSWMFLSRPGRTEWLFDFHGPSYYLLMNPGLWQEGIGVSFVSLLALRLLVRASRAKENASRESETSKDTSISKSATNSKWAIPPWMVLVAVLLIVCVGLFMMSRQK